MTTLSEKFANAATTAEDTGDETGLLFIGEGKKYKDEAAADKALAFKDEHISNIERENAELRAATQKSATLDEVLNRIQNNQKATGDQYQTETRDESQSIDIDALVAKALDEKLSAKEIYSKQETNSQTVVDELTKRYGSRAGDVYASKGAELGVDLDQLAKTSPKAVLEFFKEGNRSGGSYMEGTQNTSALKGNTETVGDYAYWTRQIKEGKISREKGYAAQHRSLQSMGAAKFYGQNS